MTRVRSPVIFVIFNRPDTTATVFHEIARAKPPKLLVIADGPRSNRPGEAEKCAKTRRIVEQVDWDCEVLTCFSEVNLGCKQRLATGLSWAFEQVEEAIVLEDDVVPDPSFFKFCDELLEKYRNEPSVMCISGTCFLGSDRPSNESYYFSDFPLIWGWASWRRAWRNFDVKMDGWPRFRRSNEFGRKLRSFWARRYFRRQLDRTFRGDLDTWDYQWTYSIWKSSGLSITPTRNLTRNIGFGPEATHTHVSDPLFTPPVEKMGFPLVHPSGPARVDPKIDETWHKRHHHPFLKVRRRLRNLFSSVKS